MERPPEFQQWLITVDDDETDIEELYREFLAEKRQNMNNLAYTITLPELLERPIIRTDFEEEWMNKMTDDELSQFDEESYKLCLMEGTPEKYPDINAACLSKHIDRTILYKLMKERK